MTTSTTPVHLRRSILRRLCIIVCMAAFVAVGGQARKPRCLISDIKPSATIMMKLPDMPSMQSMAIHGDYLVSVTKRGTATIYDMKRCNKLATLKFSQGIESQPPHANVTCFGTEHAKGNSRFPLMYVSTWYFDSHRTCLVYNLSRDRQGKWSMELVQTIKPGDIDPAVFGKGATDWVVDTDNKLLYALTYRLPGSSQLVEGNMEHVTVFRLPRLADGAMIELSDKDVVDHYEVAMWNFSQDKCYHCGHIYVGSGHQSRPFWMQLRALDLRQRRIVAQPNVCGPIVYEPEGLDIYKGRLVMVTGTGHGRVHQFHFPDKR